MKLKWRRTFIIGLGFMTVNVVWLVYNVFVPIFLQSGSRDFNPENANIVAPGFGLNASSTGFIMAIDNIAAVFLLPLIGIWSDRTRTRIGRRYPYILASVPIAATAFIFMAVAVSMITPETSGSIAANSGTFVLFIGSVIVMLLAMAVFRTPVIALMSDLTPSDLRNKANGVIDFMGGIGGIIATLGLIPLFNRNFFLPFVGTSLILIVANFTLFALVKEPALPLEASFDKRERQPNVFQVARMLPPENFRSLVLLMIAIFGWFIGFNTIEAFFSSYAVTTLGVDLSDAGLLFSVALIMFIVFSIPAGFIGTAVGRKPAILLGIVIFGGALLAAYFTVNLVLVGIILAASGLGFALINTNSLPMIIDLSDGERWIGTYTGFYYFASQMAAVCAPIVNGILIDLSRGNYSVIFLVTPCFLFVSFISMILITRGEVQKSPAAELSLSN